MGDAKIEPSSSPEAPASPSSPSSPTERSPTSSPQISEGNRKQLVGGDEALDGSSDVVPSSSSAMQAILKKMPSMEDVKRMIQNPEEAKKKLNVFVEGVSKKIFPAAQITDFSGVEDGTTDPRVERIQVSLELSHAELTKMFMLFSKHDTLGLSFVTRDDLFDKILVEPRGLLGNRMVDFIHPQDGASLRFGEFLDFFYTFCLFEPINMLKFIFHMFDNEDTGFVEGTEIRHFVYALHQTQDNSTIEQGLKYMEDNDDGDGRFEYYQIVDMHTKFPVLFFPAFRLIVQMRRNSLGEGWWIEKGLSRFENKNASDANNEKERKNKAAATKKAAEMANEELVKRRMGIGYWLMFWDRGRVRMQVNRIAAISADLEKEETVKEQQTEPVDSPPAAS